eukprot:TRINITY_DN1885_c0_g1_i1.p1 TRINITY_DN1885_c0_g1~~TRINITY_DN1885_c0_g1_i1.p1  ORF type:complete len:442 (-),score=185.40 TRINITY_DN1885_c0_g1_i1:198-1523(-)
MPPQESPADSTTPPIQGSTTQESPKKKKSKKPKKEPKPAPPPPKTTQRGELVRKATEERLAKERIALDRQLTDQRLKREAIQEKLKAKAPSETPSGPEEGSPKKNPPKPIKKSIPKWASLGTSSAPLAKSRPEKPKDVDIILEAFEAEADTGGNLSATYLKEYIKDYYPDNFKQIYAMGVKKAMEKGFMTKIRGSFKLTKAGGGSSAVSSSHKKASLEDVMPHVFTWICEPKEASAVMIKKYLDTHYPSLASDVKGFKKALENGVSKGQLERITGKGASGTFSLVDGAPKKGTRFEDPIEDAIIASNEPKYASINALRTYLDEYHPQFGVKERPKVLKIAIERLLSKGHLMRVSGKGFCGTLGLSFPYYPSPQELWGDEYEPNEEEDSKMNGSAPSKKRKKHKIVVQLKEKASSKKTTPKKAAPQKKKPALKKKKTVGKKK